MKIILKLASFIGLLLTIIPAFLVFNSKIDLGQHKTLMLAGTLLWFTTAPFWLGQQASPTDRKA